MATQITFLQVEQPPEYRPKVRELPVREQPVHRLREKGPQALSTAEVLAAVIQTPDALAQAHAMLAQFGSVAGLLNAAEEQLTQIDGVGPATAARIKAALELGARLQTEKLDDGLVIRAPADLATALTAEYANKEQEHLIVVLLNTRNKVIHQYVSSIGSLSSNHVRIADVFREAVRRNAAAIIMAHNHPSGDPTPSPEDVEITRRLVQAGDVFDIEILDHIILGDKRWVSMKERGLGFEGTTRRKQNGLQLSTGSPGHTAALAPGLRGARHRHV